MAALNNELQPGGGHFLAKSLAIAVLWLLITGCAISAEVGPKPVVSGNTYVFSTASPPEGVEYAYLWTASGGAPSTSSQPSFKWTAPLVDESTEVILELLVRDQMGGCTNYSRIRLRVEPLLPLEDLTPMLECVKDKGDGSYIAVFGYLNENQSVLSVPAGDYNYFHPAPANRGQPVQFLPGRQRSAFQVTFQDSIEWKLGLRSARASRDSPLCSFIISGRKFNDLNANGQDDDEPGLLGWTIQIKAADGSIKTVSTDSSGRYRFGDLPPGKYELTEVLQDGWTQSHPSSGEYSIELVESSLDGLDFGNYGPARISLNKSCIYSSPAKIGDAVIYTYNVTNSGGQPLVKINLSDVPDWGPGCVPTLVGGDDGNHILDPGESWIYQCYYIIPDPSDYSRLFIMAANSAAKMAATMSHLLEMRSRLEIKMQLMLSMLQQFNEKSAVLSIANTTADQVNFTFYNYTNPVTEEILSKKFDSQGNLRSIEYLDPASGQTLLAEYSPAGRIVSHSFYDARSMEYLKVEYDKPSDGLRFLTVVDYRTGDSLVIVADASGNIISKQYRKVPGIKVVEEKILLKNRATVTAEAVDGQMVSDDDTFTLEILRPLPVLGIYKKADPDPVKAGGFLNYTLIYENLGSENAHGIKIKESYDRNVSFVSAEPPPDVGTQDVWSFEALSKGESGAIKIRVLTSPLLEPGQKITNMAEIKCSENASANFTLNTTVAGALLNISKTSSRGLVLPGQLFNYTLICRNEGPVKVTQINISDYLDKNVEFQSSTPAPAYPPFPTPSDKELRWNITELEPGDETKIEMEVKAKSRDAFRENATVIVNTYHADSLQARGLNKTLKTLVVSSLWIMKSADRAVYLPDENITYTIHYGNEEIDLEATDVVVVDVLPEVEFIGADPWPNSIQGNVLKWYIGNLSQYQDRVITIEVHIPKRPDVIFNEMSSVHGQGYLQAKKRLSTTQEDQPLINRANITGNYTKEGTTVVYKASSCVGVTVAGAGTDISTSQHGSGYYREEGTAYLRMENKSIELNRDLFAQYQKTSFSLPEGRSIERDSLWSDLTTAHNRLNHGKLQENYFYTRTLEKNSSLSLDMNQTVLRSESSVGDGLARLSYSQGNPRHTEVDISENYHGSFRIKQSIDSYGESVKYVKSVRGQGFVASDKRSGKEQRSFEHGSGYYYSEEVNQLSAWNKDAKMVYSPSNTSAGSMNISYSALWQEGMVTKDPKLKTFISEKIGYATLISKETEMGPSYLSILGKFNGTMDVKAALVPKKKQQIDLVEERLIGSYQMDTAIAIYTNPRHLYPHISIAKKAQKVDEHTILFLINVTNDGNKRLNKINVTDRLPDGMLFFNSTLRPKVEGQNISWSILSLDISRTLTIKLRVTVNETYKRYVNRVNVTASYKEELLNATNSTSLVPEKMICCLETTPAPGALAYSNATEQAWTEPGWGPWKPAGCINIAAGEFEDCFKAIDDYYRDLDRYEPCSDIP